MIAVDYRERGSGVPELLKLLGAPVKFAELDVGDYALSPGICVERKECGDLVSSIVDGRLFEQARLLSSACDRPMLVVEGRLESIVERRKIKLSQVYGAIASLLSRRVVVVGTGGPVETAMFIYGLYRRAATHSGCQQCPRRVVSKYGKGVETVQLNMIASLPGVDRELAHRILMHFKTPRRFFKSSPSELRRVEGLGHARIIKIIEVLDSPFDAGPIK